MIHIRNSKPNSVFFLEHEGVPSALVTDFSETIVDGSLCIDTINQQLYQLRNSAWVLIGGGSTSNISNVVATTYNNLQLKASTGGLVAGALYQINYQTKHLIPYTNELNTGSTETLLLQAVNGTNFAQRVTSIQYPQDIIFYDFYDNKVENSPLTSRNGNIYYRKDPVKNLETHYDFRNVKFRRWEPNSALHTWQGTSGAGSNIVHKLGEVIISNSVVYVCSNQYTSTNSGFFNYDRNYTPVMRLSPTSINHNTCMWQPIIQLTENNTGVGGGDGKLYATTSGNYVDFYTFNDTFANVMRNIKIGKHSSKKYNNIVLIASAGTWASNYLSTPICKDIEIKDDCSDMMLDIRLLYDITIDYNCSDIYMSRDVNDVHIKSYSKNITAYNGMTNVNIGYDCRYIHVNNVYGFNVGNLSTKIFLNEFYNENINIGGNNTDIFIQGSYNTDIFIGDGFTDNYVGDNTDSVIYSSFDNKISDVFYNNALGISYDFYSGSNGSENIKILGGMNKHIVIGKNCNDISIANLFSGGCNNIHIGDTSTTVHIKGGGSMNIFIGSACDNIVTSNIVTSGVFNVTIKNNTTLVELNDTLNVFIDSDCQNIKIKDCNEFVVGKGCINILSNQGGSNDRNIIGDFCKDITLVSGSNYKNKFSAYSESITVSGSSGLTETTIDGCRNITFANCYVYSSKFGKNFNYATFHGGNISYVEFTAYNTSSTPYNFFNSLNCAMVDARSGSGYFFARTISDLGATIYNQYL